MKVSDAPLALWQQKLDADPGSTFFHSPAWFALWEKYRNFETKPILYEWPDGSSAILPMALERKYWGMRNWWHGSPAVNYGGLLCEKTLAASCLEDVALHLRSKKRLILRENPYSANRLPLRSAGTDRTFVVDLRSKKSLETMLRDWRVNQRRNLQKSWNCGLHCAPSKTESDWTEFAALYEKNLNFRGKAATVRYQPRLFALMCQIPAAMRTLWTVRHCGRLVAAYTVFYSHSKASCWLPASDPAQRHLHLYESLYHAIIVDAQNRGLDYVDLNPSGGIAGVEHFKKGLGTMELRANIFMS
jgi:CelD/BcsL family acetyltransferase involved in cellulose biosynthesis